MRKYLPLVVFAVAILFFIGVFFVVRGRNANTSTSVDEDETVAAIPFEFRPYTTLSPTKKAANGEMGHWLTLDIKDVKVPDATSLDYLLEYKAGETTQGVPGSVKLNGSDIQRDLLLGSESSGKFRYDTGVEQGTLTLRFRNSAGKLVGKLVTDFHLQSNTTDLSSVDGQFKFTLNKSVKGAFFVTMNTFGVPSAVSGITDPVGPFGIFTSDGKAYEGTVSMLGSGMKYWNGSSWLSTGAKTGVYVSQNSPS